MTAQEKILVTGGTGFIGKNLIKSLKNKYEVVSVSRSSKVPGVKNINIDLNVSDFSFLRKVKPDYVVYLGTISSPKQAEKFPQQCFDSNVTVIQKFLSVAKDLNVKKIVLFSSIILYKEKTGKISENDPLNPNSNIYSLSKFLLENIAGYYRTSFGLPITVFRLSNTYGPGQDASQIPFLVPSLFDQAKDKKAIEVWNSKPIRDWVYIADIVKVIEKELKLKNSGMFNLGTGVGTSVDEVSKTIGDFYSVKVKDLKKDVSPPFKVVLDMNALEEHLGYVPDTKVRVGLKKIYDC